MEMKQSKQYKTAKSSQKTVHSRAMDMFNTD